MPCLASPSPQPHKPADGPILSPPAPRPSTPPSPLWPASRRVLAEMQAAQARLGCAIEHLAPAAVAGTVKAPAAEAAAPDEAMAVAAATDEPAPAAEGG